MKLTLNSKTNSDILLPQDIKIENAESLKDKIEEIIKGEDLSKFVECRDLILKV